MKINRICVIGLGYIGLPTAVAFALAGKNVIGVDIQPDIVSTLNQGKSHLEEYALAEALQQAHASQHFRAQLQPSPADAFIIAVPTPLDDNHQPNLSDIDCALQSIAPYLKNGNLIVLESTSPVGTTENIAAQLHKLRPDLTQLHIAYCPERVLPGKIMQEIYSNDRIIGGLTPEATAQAIQLYQLFTKGECLPTEARTAELCKLVENSFRDVNIAFANELSLICDKLGIDIWHLTALANRHPRVNILQAGIGVGGHCIAVDPWFIAHALPKQAKLIRTAREINNHKTEWVFEKIKSTLADLAMKLDSPPRQLRIACLGLSFKPNVADLRESPALAICTQLAQWHQGTLWIVEPNIQQLPQNLPKNSELVPLAVAQQEADLLIELVAHHEFDALAQDNLISFVR